MNKEKKASEEKNYAASKIKELYNEWRINHAASEEKNIVANLKKSSLVLKHEGSLNLYICVGICANICGITRFVRNTAHIRANICGITSVAKMTAYICINSWGKICIAPVISHIFAQIYAFIFPV